MDEFEQVSTDQLVALLLALIESGRLSGTIKIDGMVFHDDDAENAVEGQFVSGYDPNGISYEYSPAGGARVEGIDLLVAEWIMSGDPAKEQIARETPQYYFISFPDDRNMSAEQLWQCRTNINHNSLIAGITRRVFSLCYQWAVGRYVEKLSGEPLVHQLHLDSGQHASGKYRELPWDEWMLAKLPNHQVYTMGVYHHPEHPEYESRYLKTLAERKLKIMKKRLPVVRKQIERAAAGAMLPGVGQNVS